MSAIVRAGQALALALCVALSGCGKPPASPPASTTNTGAEPSALADQSGGSESVPADEKLFAGWQQPALALLLTGQQLGYIEPCGCAGLANQKGGLARRHTLVKELQKRGWPVVAMDAGNQVRRFGRQAETKFQVAVDGLKKIGYRAVALGDKDLRLSADVLASIALGDEDSNPFVCANVAVLDRDVTPQFQIIEAAGKRIAVTAVLGTAEQKHVISGEIILQSPEDGLAEVMPQLVDAKCDLLVLLSHASLEESQRLARKYTDFDVVVTTGGSNDPTFQSEPIDGTDAILIQTGKKAMYAVVIGVFDDDQQPLRYQRVPLDATLSDSEEMLQLLASYQDQLKEVGLEGLEISPILHASESKFVGSSECKECHQKAFAVWETTPHAKATKSLELPKERSQVPRHFDPECLSCHVTGWHAQSYFLYEGGYLGLEATPELIGNGCENCHGPGSKHVAAERGDIDVTDPQLVELRDAMKLPLLKAESKCQQCHDLDNDPDFVKDDDAFKKYWPKVEHKGKD